MNDRKQKKCWKLICLLNNYLPSPNCEHHSHLGCQRHLSQVVISFPLLSLHKIPSWALTATKIIPTKLITRKCCKFAIFNLGELLLPRLSLRKCRKCLIHKAILQKVTLTISIKFMSITC